MALAPLIGNLLERGSRAATCDAYNTLAGMDPCLRTTAALLTSLEAWSTSQVSLLALQKCSTALTCLMQSMPLLLQCPGVKLSLVCTGALHTQRGIH